MTTPNTKEVLTAHDIADMLGLGINQVYNAAKRGEIPARRIGRRWIFGRAAVVSWLNRVED